MMAKGLGGRKQPAEQTVGALEKEIAKIEKDLTILQEKADICRQVLGKPTSQASAKGTSEKRVNGAEAKPTQGWV